MRHTIVPLAGRDEFRGRAQQSREHYSAVGCHYWLFEEAALPGAYVEFFEASDPEALLRAHRAAPAAAGSMPEAPRMYVEVQLS